MKMFQTRIEKDFELFVRSLPKLEPIEFCGLAKILGVPMYKDLKEKEITVEELKTKSEEEIRAIEQELTLSAEEVLEKMMDKFLGLNKRRRKEILQILKDIKRENAQGVKINGAST